MSGKGGVGKSTVAANLALAFAKAHHNKVRRANSNCNPRGTAPVTGPNGLNVVSMAFFLKEDTPVISRGPNH